MGIQIEAAVLVEVNAPMEIQSLTHAELSAGQVLVDVAFQKRLRRNRVDQAIHGGVTRRGPLRRGNKVRQRVKIDRHNVLRPSLAGLKN